MNKKDVIKHYDIDLATLKNWIKTGLKVNIDSDDIPLEAIDSFIKTHNKLTNRGNKGKSQKKVIPKELTKILDEDYLKETLIVIDEALLSLNQETILDTVICKRIMDILKKDFKNIQYLDLLNRKKSSLKINESLLEKLTLEDNNYVIGVLIQYIMGEGSQSNFGTYYTPVDIIETLIPKNIDGKTFLEPCSGSGYILFEIFKQIKKESSENPLKYIYGNDINEKAVLGSVIELIEMSKNEVEFVSPAILNQDGLTLDIEKVDYVITNPPYGSKIDNEGLELELNTKESFSFFIYRSLYSYLKDDGKLFLVLPDSILKIKAHSLIREHMLDNGLYKVDFLGKRFKGVMSDIVLLYIDKSAKKANILYVDKDGQEYVVDRNVIHQTPYFIINKYKTASNHLKVKEMLKKEHYFMEKDFFYLGVVTGNNKLKIKTEMDESYNTEVIQGKNFANEDKYYISLADDFQQTPNYEVFARNKILYKFISSTIRTKVDDRGVFTINSVNIYSPLDGDIEDLKKISTQLNSKESLFILNFYYGDIVKILKEHLCSIPIFKK